MHNLPLWPQDDNPTLKQCRRCRLFLSVTSFAKAKREKDGLQQWCKSCRKQHYDIHKEEISERARRRYELHKEEINERRRANGKDKNREWMRQYRETDKWKEYVKEYRKRRYQERRDELIDKQKQYYTEHKEAISRHRSQQRKTEQGRMYERAHKHKRKAMKKEAGGSYTSEQLQEQLKRQKGKCYYCHMKLGKGKGAWHADHSVPLSRGGSNDISNIVITCPPCNMKKHNKLPHEWPDGGRLF